MRTFSLPRLRDKVWILGEPGTAHGIMFLCSCVWLCLKDENKRCPQRESSPTLAPTTILYVLLTNMRPSIGSSDRRGAWMCHRCAASGSWYDLKRRAGCGGVQLLSGHGSSSSPVPMPGRTNTARRASTPRRAGGDEVLVAQQRAVGLRPVPDQLRVRSYPANLLHNPRFSKVKAYLTGTKPGQRGMRHDVLIKYGVGCAAYR